VPKTTLTEGGQRGLYRAALAAFAWATPLITARTTQGDTLDYEERRDFLRIHRRGERRPHCGTRITEITAGGRITDFCGACQPGGPRRSRDR
jgi:formamidopyrimidine-DNA glycosylase